MVQCSVCKKELKVLFDGNPFNSDIYYNDDKIVCKEHFKKKE